MASEKKVALITGANKGLGLEMARQLAQTGVTVVPAARDAQKGEAAAKTLHDQGLDVQFLKLDVTDKRDYPAAVTFLEQNFGKLDILINNAGVSGGGIESGKPSTINGDLMRQTFETNLFAPVELTQALLPLLKKSAAGRIVNM